MRTQQAGFTFIELIVVIVVLGILGAVAVPKFVNVAGDAYDASAKASAGALSSATAINYAKKNAGSGGDDVITGKKCSDLLPLMVGSKLSSDTGVDFENGNNTITCGGSGTVDSVSCKVKHLSGATSGGFAVSLICTG